MKDFDVETMVLTLVTVLLLAITFRIFFLVGSDAHDAVCRDSNNTHISCDHGVTP